MGTESGTCCPMSEALVCLLRMDWVCLDLGRHWLTGHRPAGLGTRTAAHGPSACPIWQSMNCMELAPRSPSGPITDTKKKKEIAKEKGEEEEEDEDEEEEKEEAEEEAEE